MEAQSEHLLPGEDPDSHYPEDAEHWVDVYRELSQQIAVVNTHMPTQSDEDPIADEPKLDEELARIRNRLAFWERRVVEMRPRP